MKILFSVFLMVILTASSLTANPLLYSNNYPNEAYAQLSDAEIRDIGNYVILGFDETIIEQNVIINSGNVGVQNANAQVTIKEGTFLDSNSALAGDIVKIELNARAQNVIGRYYEQDQY